MSTASEQAAGFLAANTTKAERVVSVRGETGDHARLRELIVKDDLSDDENDEFETLSAKNRSGTLEGSPRREVIKRRSIGGERNPDGNYQAKALTASEQAARILNGYT